MDYVRLDKELIKWQDSYKDISNIDTPRSFGFHKETVATIEEIEEAEKKLKISIPPSLREFFLKYSKKLEFFASLKDEFCENLPDELSSIFCASIEISLDSLIRTEESRQGWVEYCFTDENNEYDKVYYNKLGFIGVMNGDIIALDLNDKKEDHSVVYLSHDEGEGHGYILGNSFNEFLENYIAIGLCGEEDWQMLPFIKDSTSGINPNCPNAITYRKLVFSWFLLELVIKKFMIIL